MNYKKAIAGIALVPLLGVSAFADNHMMMETTSMNTQAANFLAEQNVIVNQSNNTEMYNLGFEITRREMIKVAMNISGKNVPNTCAGTFSDLHSTDFSCKYAEAALANGYIAANTMFRPDDLITEAEALKMIMQAKGITRDDNDDWRLGYSSKAMSEGVISQKINLKAIAQRGWIFESAARTYSEYTNAAVTLGTIVDTAVATESLSTLVTAVTAAGLVETLQGAGPFTVFAPTNDAFAALPEGTVASLLLEENVADLSNILTYHVVAGSYAAGDITDGLELTTVQGQSLVFTLVDGKVMINGTSEVVLADVATSNGTVHVIDAVLTPNAEAQTMMDIVDTAVATESLSTLVTALTAAGLVETLQSAGPFTVFAPTNDAFAALPEGTVASLLLEENVADLSNILTYHVVAGSYAAGDITDGLELTTVQGQSLIFTLVDGKVMINGTSEVVLADVATSNGTVHVIDAVLLPTE